MEALLAQHGSTLVAFATRAYELPWRAGGYTVHASAYANWAGSYSTRGDLIVMSTRDRSMQGLFTAGYAVQQVVPRHIPYAVAFGVWSQRLSGASLPAQRLKPLREEIWKPHLDGPTSRDAAFAALVGTVSEREAPDPSRQVPR